MTRTVSLRSNRDFRRLYARARSAPGACLVLFLQRNRLGVNRLGLTVSSKLGGAVIRNRLRRRLKEAYRLSEDRLPSGYDVVIVARTAAGTAEFSRLRAELERLFIALCSQEKPRQKKTT